MRSCSITIPGDLVQPLSVKRPNALLSLTLGEKPNTIHFESQGLVVAYNGGGDGAHSDGVLELATELAIAVAQRGGINMNGGRKSGVMGTVMRARPKSSFGVLSENQLDKKSDSGCCAVVGSKHTRLEILSILAPIVVAFPGGIGTVQEWVTSLVAWKDMLGGYSPVPAPMLFLYQTWKPIIEFLERRNALPKSISEKIFYFSTADELLDRL